MNLVFCEIERTNVYVVVFEFSKGYESGKINGSDLNIKHTEIEKHRLLTRHTIERNHFASTTLAVFPMVLMVVK